MKADTPQAWKDAIATLPPDGCDTAGCPLPEKIWSAVCSELSTDEFDEVVDHTATCPVCSLAWQMAEKGVVETGVPRVDRSRQPWRAWYGLAAAAVLVAAAALVIQFREPDLAPVTATPEYRAPVEEAVLSNLEDGAVLERDDCTLSWTGPDEATYNILIATEDFQVLHREYGWTARSFIIPSQALQDTPSGGVIVWQVEAVLPDGTRKPSRTFRVTVK